MRRQRRRLPAPRLRTLSADERGRWMTLRVRCIGMDVVSMIRPASGLVTERPRSPRCGPVALALLLQLPQVGISGLVAALLIPKPAVAMLLRSVQRCTDAMICPLFSELVTRSRMFE